MFGNFNYDCKTWRFETPSRSHSRHWEWARQVDGHAPKPLGLRFNEHEILGIRNTLYCDKNIYYVLIAIGTYSCVKHSFKAILLVTRISVYIIAKHMQLKSKLSIYRKPSKILLMFFFFTLDRYLGPYVYTISQQFKY